MNKYLKIRIFAFLIVVVFVLSSCTPQSPPLLTVPPTAEILSAAAVDQPVESPTPRPVTADSTGATPDKDTSVTFGYTYLRADGNRRVSGRGTLPESQFVDIPLMGEPQWLVSASSGEGSIWTVVLADGNIQAFYIEGGRYEPISIAPEHIHPGQPPLLKVHNGAAIIIEAPGQNVSPLTHPVVLSVEGMQIAFIENTGDVVIWENGELARLAVDALPDARLIMDKNRNLLVLTGPTRHYDHGVLGDDFEASGISLVETSPSTRVAWTVQIEAPAVIEGIAPIWTDLTGDGEREIIFTRSDASQGAQIVVLNNQGEEIATGSAIGRGYRWRNQLGVGPLGPDGGLEFIDVLTPHIGGVVEFFKLAGDNLELVSESEGFTSHVIGSRNLDMGMLGDFDGDGFMEVLLPKQSRTELAGIQRLDGSAEVVWTIPVGGRVSTNLSAAALTDGSMVVGIGREDDMLRIWYP